ncbi:hypothetical protein ACIQU6_37130 [Streptomyces sp. NPDC090442]|uniref:hypothetical protein n=1 Tax=Streptomyces sp. NPDC090442 TaxID=3365962 RepID=UPI00380A37DF
MAGVWTERTTEHGATAELPAVLQLVAAGRLRCSNKTMRPSAATIRALGEVLTDGDFYEGEAVRAFAWPLLLQAGGLSELSSGRLELTARGRRALAGPAHETVRHLWRRWLNRGVLDEFSRIEEVKGQRAANVLSATGPRRQAVGAALAECCPPGEWVTVDELFKAMRAAGYDPCPVRSDRVLWKLYLEDAQYGSLGYDGHHDWSVLQGRYTLCVLFEYAATLGLVDVRYVAHVWTLSTVSLLKALHTGRGLEELRRFLTENNVGDELPQTVTALLAEAASRTEKVRDLGTCHVLECVDEAQAVVIASDHGAGALCSRIGRQHLMVAPGDLPAFRASLLKLGCVLPARL